MVGEDAISAVICMLVVVPWVAAYCAKTIYAKGTGPRALASRVCSELRPFYVPCELFRLIRLWQSDEIPWFARVFFTFTAVAVIFLCWARDDDDDDVWRKRGRKLKQWVGDRMARLAPAPA